MQTPTTTHKKITLFANGSGSRLVRRRRAGGGGRVLGRRRLLARGGAAPAWQVEGGVEFGALALAVLQILLDLLVGPKLPRRFGPRDAVPVGARRRMRQRRPGRLTRGGRRGSPDVTDGFGGDTVAGGDL